MGPYIFYVTHTNIHSYAHTYLHQIYSKAPLGYLLELFLGGPCLLEWVFLAARASKRSHCLLTRRGYPRPLAHSQALLPGSGFTSKTQRMGGPKCIFQLTLAHSMQMEGGITTHLHHSTTIQPGYSTSPTNRVFQWLTNKRGIKQGTSSYNGSESMLTSYKKWSHYTAVLTKFNWLLL